VTLNVLIKGLKQKYDKIVSPNRKKQSIFDIFNLKKLKE
jgi:hypothetical protein